MHRRPRVATSPTGAVVYKEKERHQGGSPNLSLMRESSWTLGQYFVFLGLPFVDALLSQGASGLSLRPVHGMGPTISPQVTSLLA